MDLDLDLSLTITNYSPGLVWKDFWMLKSLLEDLGQNDEGALDKLELIKWKDEKTNDED